MTHNELAEYAGEAIFALCTRMGTGYHTTMFAGQIYRITENGTLRHEREVMNCVTSKAQRVEWEKFTGGNYFKGRPTASRLTVDQIEKLIK
jgi:hypothetical protein